MHFLCSWWTDDNYSFEQETRLKIVQCTLFISWDNALNCLYCLDCFQMTLKFILSTYNFFCHKQVALAAERSYFAHVKANQKHFYVMVYGLHPRRTLRLHFLFSLWKLLVLSCRKAKLPCRLLWMPLPAQCQDFITLNFWGNFLCLFPRYSY